ncbi:MAG: type IV secretion system protein [Desulfobulbus sp.]|nr:type IV secretion system protein [Desulfobulbus sp.]
MVTPAAFHFFTDLFTKINATLESYIQSTASDIITSITPVATTMLTIYVMFWGWSMLRGTISEPVTDGVQRIVRLEVIVGIALSLGQYNTFVANFLWQSPDALAAIIASGSSVPATSTQFLDQFAGHFYDVYVACAQMAKAEPWSSTVGIPDLSLLLWGAGVLLAGMLLTAYAAFLLVLSKIALAVLLAIGPIPILMSMFEATKRFLDTWLGQAFNFVFLAVLTAAMIKIMLTIIQTYLLGAVATPEALANPSTVSIVIAIVFCTIGLLVLWQVPSIASALGGGVAIGTLGAVGALYGKSKGAVAATRPVNVRRQFVRGIADLKIASAPIRAVWNKTRGNNKVFKNG